MSTQIFYLTLEQILVIHEDQIDRYGGSHGLRDLVLLESAVYRPQTTFGNKDLYPSVYVKAAALLHSLMFNHSFIDGNKRTATASMLIFFNLNGYQMLINEILLVEIILKIETEKWSIDKIAKWLEYKLN